MDSLRENLPRSFLTIRQWAGDLGLIGQSSLSLKELIQFALAPQTYEVIVQTGTTADASTDDDIFITVFGSRASLSEQELDNDEDNFERGKRDVFQLTGPHLGEIQRIRIRRNRNLLRTAWYLDQITIRKVSTNQAWSFPCRRWLSSDRMDAPDCAVDLIIPVNGPAVPNPDVQHQCAGPSQTGTPVGTGNTSPLAEASQLHLYNCHVSRLSIRVWVFDITAGTRKEVGSLSPQHDSSGQCPASGATSMSIELKKGHHYAIIATDPGNTSCNEDDPSIVSCQRWQWHLIGNPQAAPAFGTVE